MENTKNNALFHDIEVEIDTSFNSFKKNLKLAHDKIDNRVEYIRDEIEIRFETVRNEVNNLHDKFNSELDRLKERLIKSLECKIQYEGNNDFIEKQLTDLQNELNSSVENLSFYNETLATLQKMIKKLESVDIQISFKASSVELDEASIGKLRSKLQTRKSHEEISSLIKSHQFQIKDLLVKPSLLLILPNDSVLVSAGDSLILYDDDYQLVKQIDTLNGHRFDGCYMATTNDMNKIYISLPMTHETIMSDLDLNVLSAFGSFGSEQHQLCYPHGLTHHEDSVYICDTKNRRVSKVDDESLRLEETFKLTYEPLRIEILNENVCIQPRSICCIYFHDISDMSISKRIERHCGNISRLNQCIYEYYGINKTIYCYNDSGELIEEMKLHESIHEYLDTSSDGHIVFYNDKIAFISHSKSKLLLF